MSYELSVELWEELLFLTSISEKVVEHCLDYSTEIGMSDRHALELIDRLRVAIGDLKTLPKYTPRVILVERGAEDKTH